jgi:DNA-binding response OmpR family regulator
MEITQKSTDVCKPSIPNDKMKLLLIEDDIQIQDTLRLSFQIYWPEIELEFADKGIDAIYLADNNIYNAIILDLVLPDISGFNVLSKIKTLTKTPIIIFTADHSFANYERAMVLGASDYILKPFKQKELFSRIQQHLTEVTVTH